jgi:hypothetical protein
MKCKLASNKQEIYPIVTFISLVFENLINFIRKNLKTWYLILKYFDTYVQCVSK